LSERQFDLSIQLEERYAKILRWVLDLVGADVVPVLADKIEKGELEVPFTADELRATYLWFWDTVDESFPNLDGNFYMEDLTKPWYDVAKSDEDNKKEEK